MNPLVLLAGYALVSVGLFLFGLRFFRMTEPPAGVTLDQAKRFGRLAMIGAAMLLVALIAFWLHGDIRLGQPVSRRSY